MNRREMIISWLTGIESALKSARRGAVRPVLRERKIVDSVFHRMRLSNIVFNDVSINNVTVAAIATLVPVA